MLEPCSTTDGSVGLPSPCLPPRPFSVEYTETVVAGATTRIDGTFTNTYESNITRALAGIETPQGWQKRPVSGSTYDAVGFGYLPVDRLEPGDSEAVAWDVTIPATAGGGRYNVTAISEWRVPGYGGLFGNSDADHFRLRRNYTYVVEPAACRGVEPCSLLAGNRSGGEPFGSAEGDIDPIAGNATSTVAGYLYNPHGGPITNGTVALDASSEGLNVTPVNGTAFGSIAPGESRPVAWNLTVAGSSGCDTTYTLTGETTYELDGESITVPFSFVVETEPDGPCLVL
jgi:hypothetical protein